jgi:hypothetical protein
VAGGVVGAVVFGALLSFGFLLSSRVDNVIPVIVLGVAGAYIAWLVGVVVFGAVRGGSDNEEQGEP